MKRSSLLAAGSFLFASILATAAWAQGVLVIVNPPHPVPLPRPWPRPPSPPAISYKIKEVAVQARIKDQVAQVQVSQTFVNTGSGQIETKFLFPLPYDGAIDSMTFLVDGKEYEAKLLPAKQAREIFEGHVRRNKDPALLEWMGQGMFQTSVFPIPPGAERKVTLKFSQLLRKNHQLTDFLYPLATAKYTSQAIEKVSLEANIESAHEIKSVYSPTHAVEVQRPDPKRAVVKFTSLNSIPTSDFRLFFDSADGKLGASVLSYRPNANEDGYYLLLASPEVKTESMERAPKTVIIVLDRSGSMSGKKIDQAKEAAKFVLNNLREKDTFNMVAYDSTVESFRPELQKYDDESRKAALGYIEGLYPGGGTNIDGGLATALGMIQDGSRPTFVLFLTDGLPTQGETNEAKIVANAKQRNTHKSRMIVFGVGYDLNSRLLDKLSRENFGQSEYVRPDENIEASVSRVYNRMSSPVMTNVAVKVDVEGATVETGPTTNRMYPREVYDLFAGEQLIQVGRYKKPGAAKVTITGKIGSEEKKHDFPGTLIEKSNDQTYAFVEKLWALRRIGEIIDELDLKGRNEELVQELVGLSTKHGILTPYTSFLADETAKLSELSDVRESLRRANTNLDALSVAEGRSGVAQRAEKYAFQSASRAANAAGGFGGASRGLGVEAKAAAPATSAPGAGRFRDIATDREVATEAVQNVGRETLYKRGKLWIATNAKDVDPEKQAAQIKKIERFSDEYFELVKANTDEENAILAQQQPGDELLVKLRGQVYRIE